MTSARCDEIMKRRIETVPPSTAVAEAARHMEQHGVGFLPVCAASGEVVGVVTDRDIALRVCGDELPVDVAVDRIMTRHVVACAPDDPLHRAEALMAKYGVHRVLVLDQERRLAGVVSLTDVAQCEEPIRLARLVRDISAHDVRVESSHG